MIHIAAKMSALIVLLSISLNLGAATFLSHIVSATETETGTAR